MRYYRPRNPTHEASVLCSHLARFVQEELDAYAQWNPNFPPPATRPQGILMITDRSMDLVAPLIHEFTYQAMAHDLLPIREGDKVMYKTIVNEGEPDEKEKEMEIGEKDKIWIENRHSHMKDTIEKLMGDFQKFIDDNPHFTDKSGDATSLNAIKDMLAGLPQFQELKEAYALHLSMAQECMNIFQHRKLPDVASVEQTLATGLDEDYRKPKNIADQVVRLLDDESINPADRLRLVMLYVLYRDGLIPDDIQRLLAHSALPPSENIAIQNLDLLGARTLKTLKDARQPPLPIFARRTAPTAINEEYALSRFEPALKLLLEEGARGTLDQSTFPYTKPPLETEPDAASLSNASLRSAKPTWARNRLSTVESRQRVIVFMAGGATYSEARACYEVSRSANRDIVLATSHMLTPALFVRQVSDLSKDKRLLDIPAERPRQKAPAHVFEREQPKPMIVAPQLAGGKGPALPMVPGAAGRGPVAPTQAMANMSVSSGGGGLPTRPGPVNGAGAGGRPTEEKPAAVVPLSGKEEKAKLKKEKDKEKGDGEKEKKKRHFFGSKK